MTAVANPVPQQQGAVPNQVPDDGGVQTYSYNPGGPAPVFSFNIPQVTDPPAGVPEDELNAFSVVFLDANYNEIDYSVVDSNGDYSDEDVDGFPGLAAVANSGGVFVGGSYIRAAGRKHEHGFLAADHSGMAGDRGRQSGLLGGSRPRRARSIFRSLTASPPRRPVSLTRATTPARLSRSPCCRPRA